MKPGGWGDPATAHWYREFERLHGRYRRANAALARHAALSPGMRVLDLAAGTGGTTAAMLPALGPQGHVDCIEPAAPMADAGRLRVGTDARVHWHRSLRALASDALHDRIVCGAALWQWPDLPRLLQRLARRLAPGGALVFDIPAAYVGQPDGPGGGSDPYLTALVQRLGPTSQAAAVPRPAPTAAGVTAALQACGLTPRPWRHRQRLTQAAWRDWLKIPVLTDAWWPGVPADERARRIDAAAEGLDMASWRPETWLGWTAWRPAFAWAPLSDGEHLHASRDGALLLRRAVPVAAVQALHAVVRRAARHHGLLDTHGNWVAGRATAPDEMPAWLALQATVAGSEPFRALAGVGPLQQAVSAALGCAVETHRGSVCRVAAPDHLVPATPPHRDADYLSDAAGTWTAWLPLQRCGLAEGALAVARGTHTPAGAKREPRWAGAEMAPGDVMLFDAHTLHRAHPNQRFRQARLSVDFRFQVA